MSPQMKAMCISWLDIRFKEHPEPELASEWCFASYVRQCSTESLKRRFIDDLVEGWTSSESWKLVALVFALFSHKQARPVRRLFSMPASVVEHCHAADFIPLFLLVPTNCSNKYYDAALIHSFVILRVNLVSQPSKIFFHHQEASQNWKCKYCMSRWELENKDECLLEGNCR